MRRFAVAAGAALLAATAAAQDFSTARATEVISVSGGQNWLFGSACYRYDDGTSEDSLGLTAGGNMAWFQWFDPPTEGCQTIASVSAAIGWTGRTSELPLIGTQLRAWVWDDPNNDGDATDLGSPIASGSAAITNADDDLPNVVRMDIPVTVTSRFFIGVAAEHDVGQFPGPLDQDSTLRGRAWIAGNNDPGQSFDPNNVGGGLGIRDLESIGFAGVWLMTGDVCENPCDMDCDGEVNAFDIEPFLDLLFGPDPMPCCEGTGDTNGDGVVNAFDIEPFLDCLFP